MKYLLTILSLIILTVIQNLSASYINSPATNQLFELIGAPQLVESIIQQGADVNARDQNGYTPLQLASQFGRNETVKILLKHDANTISVTPYGQTALDLAFNQEIRDDIIARNLEDNKKVHQMADIQAHVHHEQPRKPVERESSESII